MIITSTPHQLEKQFLGDPENLSESHLMRDLFQKILSLAKLKLNVVIVGEIGSGKKRVAKIIHKNSNCFMGPFHSYYCVDIDEEEYQEAFWGHLKFEDELLTLRYDVLEKASGGTLFLDQFSELTPWFMLKIIDSITKGNTHLFHRNKSSRPRIILSFNQESYQKITNSVVWNELLNKLNPIVIMLPPLRERKEDLSILINYFLKEIKRKNKNWKELSISDRALNKCFEYNWPGNVLQLKNALLQGAILSCGQTIETRHLPFSMNWQLPYEFEGKRIKT